MSNKKSDINEIVQSLKEIQSYFPYSVEENEPFPRNSFSSMINIATVPKDVHDKLLDLRNGTTCR